MDIVAERAPRKAAKSEVQSSLKLSPVADDDPKLKISYQAKPVTFLHANPINRAAKHAPPPANPKPKAPKLKASDVTESDQGDGSGSEEGDGMGDEEEDEERGDEDRMKKKGERRRMKEG
ncbi:hypothetical protein Tco_0985033 [Tanacetum coccineum]